jgi:hypothetical protein
MERHAPKLQQTGPLVGPDRQPDGFAVDGLFETSGCLSSGCCQGDQRRSTAAR